MHGPPIEDDGNCKRFPNKNTMWLIETESKQSHFLRLIFIFDC